MHVFAVEPEFEGPRREGRSHDHLRSDVLVGIGPFGVAVVVGVGFVRAVAVHRLWRLRDARDIGLASREGRFVFGAAGVFEAHAPCIPQNGSSDTLRSAPRFDRFGWFERVQRAAQDVAQQALIG